MMKGTIKTGKEKSRKCKGEKKETLRKAH